MMLLPFKPQLHRENGTGRHSSTALVQIHCFRYTTCSSNSLNTLLPASIQLLKATSYPPPIRYSSLLIPSTSSHQTRSAEL